MEGTDSNYFKSKYLINTNRLKNWDYSNPDFYFVTICTQNRKNLLGKIKNGIMGLNVLGCIVYREWLKTAQLRKNIRLDEFIIMPNHLHGIIEILSNNRLSKVETHCNASLQRANKFGSQSNNLPAIIRGFKGSCTNKIYNLGYKNFAWQSRYYEHIIRTDTESLEKIRWYIKYNPYYWQKDRNNPVNLQKYTH